METLEGVVKRSFHKYANYEELLSSSEVDAVHVAVEPENVAQVVIDCLKAGKHVLSDVPMAYTLEEIWNIIYAVEASSARYMFGEALRYWPFMEKWKELRENGTLGEIVYAEGQYLHGMQDNRYYHHPETHAQLTHEEALKIPGAQKSRMWNLRHPILYLPHTLSPLLSVLDDRVSEVVCMGNKRCHAHEWYPFPDLETAIMRTERDTILRVSAGFTVQQPHKPTTMYHWYNVMGTQGSVETHRSAQDKMKIFQPGCGDKTARDVPADFASSTLPEEARHCSHEGVDYFVFRHFIDGLLNGTKFPMDVYAAAETAAPAILAAQSAEQGSACLKVPNFRPGPDRAYGEKYHSPSV